MQFKQILYTYYIEVKIIYTIMIFVQHINLYQKRIILVFSIKICNSFNIYLLSLLCIYSISMCMWQTIEIQMHSPILEFHWSLTYHSTAITNTYEQL